MKIVSESIKRTEDDWANVEIERWQQKKAGINPLKHYIKNVIDIIMNNLGDDFIKKTGITDYIIEDIITADVDEDDLINSENKNVYDFYNEHVKEEIAASSLLKTLQEYIDI